MNASIAKKRLKWVVQFDRVMDAGLHIRRRGMVFWVPAGMYVVPA